MEKEILKRVKRLNKDLKEAYLTGGERWHVESELAFLTKLLALCVVGVTLKEKHKRMIEELENDLKILHQDEDFRLSDNSEWSKQLGFAEGKLSVLQNL